MTIASASAAGTKNNNQDAACYEQLSAGMWFCGVFDGHGPIGEVLACLQPATAYTHSCAQVASGLAAKLLPLLLSKSISTVSPDEALRSAIDSANQTIQMVSQQSL